MKRKELLDVVRREGINSEDIVDKLVKQYMSCHEKSDMLRVKKEIKIFVAKLKLKYCKCNRMYQRLITTESEWLDKDILVEEGPVNAPSGRPSLPY